MNNLRWVENYSKDRFELKDSNDRILIIVDYSYEYDNKYYYYEIYDCGSCGILTPLFYKKNSVSFGNQLEVTEFKTLESIKEYVEKKINNWVNENFNV